MGAESIIKVILVVSLVSTIIGIVGRLPSFVEKKLSSKRRKRYLDDALSNEKENSPFSKNYHKFVTKGIQCMSEEAIRVCVEEKQWTKKND